MKVHVVPACSAGPVSPDASTVPSQFDEPCGLRRCTLSQSTRMKVNGQAARIQPIVPPMRTMPNSFCAILHVGEGDGVGDRNRRHVEQAMHEHREEERPERRGERERQHREAADQVAERQELLRGEIAIRELVAEEHADDGGDREGVENPATARAA